MATRYLSPRSLIAVGAAGLFILAGSACGKKLDPTSSQDSIKTQLSTLLPAESGVTIQSVSCPTDIEAKTGVSFECTVTLSNGKTGKVKGTQVDDNGKFTIEPAGGEIFSTDTPTTTAAP